MVSSSNINNNQKTSMSSSSSFVLLSSNENAAMNGEKRRGPRRQRREDSSNLTNVLSSNNYNKHHNQTQQIDLNRDRDSYEYGGLDSGGGRPKRRPKSDVGAKIVSVSKAMTYILMFFVVFNLFVLTQSRRIPANQLESFCRSYPLHRSCMGVFAGGGKRSMNYPDVKHPIRIPDTKTDDDDNNNYDYSEVQTANDDDILSDNTDKLDWDKILSELKARNGKKQSWKNVHNTKYQDDEEDDEGEDVQDDEIEYKNGGGDETSNNQTKQQNLNLEKKILLYKLLKRLIALRHAEQQQQQQPKKQQIDFYD